MSAPEMRSAVLTAGGTTTEKFLPRSSRIKAEKEIDMKYHANSFHRRK